MKHRFILLAVLLALGSVLRGAEQAPRPNLILIFIDDMGYGDIGPFGSTKNRTPHLDRMAREGMKLTSFYAAPVCSVSRAQVITGCYGQRVSLPGVLFPGNRQGLNAAEHTIAELLKLQGYATMCIGKWHLGDQPEFLPTRHGFDRYFGLPYSNDMPRPAAATGQAVVPLVRDDRAIELLTAEGQDRLVERYTDEAVGFIREHRDRPFFLYLPHTAVHVPIHPGAKFRGKSANGLYGDWVEEVDWSVGRVLETVRELQLERRTLVVFTSDNGPWLSRGKDGGDAGPLRGGKGSTWEGGVREPTLAWWPGKIAPGSVCSAVAGNIDLLPTFVTLAGGTVPADRPIDGRDISPLLLGQSQESPREAHYYYRGYKLEAVRAGPWKLALSPQGAGMGVAGERPTAGLRLYNLETDIGEQTDVAAQHPEEVKRLQTLAARMAADLGDGQPGPGVRPAGSVENATLLYPSRDVPRAKPNRKARTVRAGKPVALETLKPADAVASEDGPQVANRPLTITCEVAAKSPAGVIIAHGGSAVGYALYFKAGRLAFAVRTSTQTVAEITAREPPPGRLTVEARLAADGTMTLTLNGQPAATGKAGGLLTRQPQEDFCVGHDNGVPVTDYGVATRFEGSIERLKVVTGSQP
jgi:arylsulfatase A-like enzyme